MIGCINETKRLVKKQVKNNEIYDVNYPFTRYSKIYRNTNENIHETFSLIDFNNIDNALIVLSSGDYLFNIILNGVYEVDTFDTNSLTEYYVFGFKTAMLTKYDYQTFLKINQKLIDDNITLDEVSSIISDLLPYMNQKYRKFWQKIADYNYKLQKNSSNPINLFSLLGYERKNLKPEANTYSLTEENYNSLKQKLNKAQITYKCFDAVNIGKYSKEKKYDLILLSNVLDFFADKWGADWGYATLSNYLKELDKISSDDATILLAYCLNHKNDKLIKNSIITKEEFKNNLFYVPSFYNPASDDALILTRKSKLYSDNH